ncbi:intergrin alpha chain protein, putative [Trypanosoma brucei gambiense DAL972]|uniref:Intergrin alpha chain protein, putative n=1 Tax=Trypanosoma brucei gambiense (strain MHOM/CI/86/DAL972) TaxID=679716 RepID=C9ZI81_TRYB9|nr:intergrin alpha chain protein, putative [Trypanosoma brucei gambiense DAL972]CBH08873.1 intergrin alpha chain protein, putative [Trypanosoma brucei gambiense DAL972]|eukprot:XP_011771314.1 intergrin alpha chain protein, putative [Trypanosoma brucei gambiense DAL972]
MACSTKRDASDIRDGRTERRLPAIPLDAWAFRRMAPQGSITPSGLITADVDGDGVEEVIIGTTEGQLLLLKMGYRTPVYSRTIPATISVVLYSAKTLRLLLVTLEGQCEVIEGFITGSKTIACSSRGGSTTSSRKRDEDATAGVMGSEMCSGGSHSGVYSECLDKEYQPCGVSYIFSIPPNCICGDIGADEKSGEGNIVFLGSYDGHVYVYSVSPLGERLGLLFLHSHVSSIKSFIVPANGTALPPSTEDHLTCAESSSTTTASFTMETWRRCSLLLVCCSQRIVLLGASREEIMHWQGHHQPRTVSMVGYVCEGCAATSACMRPTDAVGSLTIGMETPLSDSSTSLNKTAPLEPKWQFPLYHLSKSNVHLPTEEGGRQVAPQEESTAELHAPWLLPWKYSQHQGSSNATVTTLEIQQCRHSYQRQHDSVASTSTTHDHGESSPKVNDADVIIRSPAAVDVATAPHAAQFAVATEDGRWFIFEMLLAGSSIGTASPGRIGDGPVEGSTSSFRGTVVCLMSGCVQDAGFVERVRVVNVGNDGFQAIFLSMDGTCYALDAHKNTVVTSRVKAGALSFTVMGCASENGEAGSPAGNTAAAAMRQNEALSSLAPCGFSLVSVAVDEVVVLSIGGESHEWTPPTGAHGLVRDRGSSALQTRISTNEGGRGIHEGGEQSNRKLLDQTENDAPDEDAVMLKLGTLLLRGSHNPGDVERFSEEYRRFVARKFCAFGLTQKEWRMLQQLGE